MGQVRGTLGKVLLTTFIELRELGRKDKKGKK